MGDPQAPATVVRGVLGAHELLDGSGRLRDDVHLVSLGDHFDWGRKAERAQATADGLETLSWLSSHDPEQVTLLLGNHDLARVGELSEFDQATFELAQRAADAVYRLPKGDERADAERALLERYPTLPDAECLARDYSCFSTAQRDLVTRLLRTGRFRLAASLSGALLVHAGVTVADGAPLRLDDAAGPDLWAERLNRFLDERVGAWVTGPLNLEPFHRPGSAARGEGVGALYHRPADPKVAKQAASPPPRRRFDPREVPLSLTQVVGHIRDAKCRELMPAWADPDDARDGIRSLVTDGRSVRYASGVVAGAQLIFADAGMNHVPFDSYPLFDVDARRVATPRRTH